MTTPASWDQSALVDDLLTTIENDPTSVYARTLLVEQYEGLGWDDAAANEARTIFELFPDAPEAFELRGRYGKKPPPKPKKGKQKQAAKKPAVKKKPVRLSSTKHSTEEVQKLGVECVALQADAKELLQELTILAELAPEIDCKERNAELTALAEGRLFSVARGRVGEVVTASTTSAGATSKASTTRSARAVAASMKADPKKALNIAISDLESVVDRTSATAGSANGKDALRDAAKKRADAVKSGLSADMAHIALDALMHVEHEKLKKVYQNTETMLGDEISSIARDDFWVSEDGYAWDMDELVQAIQANKGAMRNPLTKETFSTDDVAAIIRHPKGKQLAALEVKQNQLKQGVRKQTIEMLRTLSDVLLHDMSENSQPSHEAVDAFLLYAATLPKAEQDAIDKLRVDATDSHSGQKFSDTIGDAVRDAKGNRICFHKAGDFFGQAAKSLGK